MSKHFLSLISLIPIFFCSCSNDTSNTKIPLSTNYVEVSNLYHEALALNNIYKGNEAKEKLLKTNWSVNKSNKLIKMIESKKSKSNYKFSHDQVTAILDLRLQKLTALGINAVSYTHLTLPTKA